MATAAAPAAAPTVPGQIVGDLNDPDYINWYKANRALHCTIDVLRNVCFAEIQNYHYSLLLKHGPGTCSKPCSHSDIITHGKWGSWSIPCPNNVCSKWLSDIVRGRSTKSTRLNWQNSEFSQWQTTPWQLAKVFMDHGQDRSCVAPADTDAAGIMQMLINFKSFGNTMDTTKVDAVRKVRNELMHNTNMKVSSADLSRYIKTMITLLQDPIKLLQDKASQDAVTEITQIETDVIEVNDQAFLKQERTIWKTHIAGQADDNKQELHKVINTNTNLESRLQGVVQDIVVLKADVKSLDEKTGEVREEVKDLGKKTDEVREEVKDVAKQLDEKTDEVREEVKDLGKKTYEVREEVKDVAKQLDEKTGEVREEVKDLGKKTDEVREEVKDVAKQLDEKTGEVREEVKDLGKKTDGVREEVKDVTKRLDEKTVEVDEMKAQMQKYDRLQQKIDVEQARIDNHEHGQQDHEQRLQDRKMFMKTVEVIYVQFTQLYERDQFTQLYERDQFTQLYERDQFTQLYERDQFTQLYERDQFTQLYKWDQFTQLYERDQFTQLYERDQFTQLYERDQFTQLYERDQFTQLYERDQFTKLYKDSSLDDMFVELRLQKSQTTKLPETLGYRDVVKMQEIMQSVDPIQVSQLFDKLHDRQAPRNVLILGKAGIGKTTLVKQIAKQWAEKKLWNDDVEYLFVITLRELRQERKLTLGDILLGGLGLTEEEKSEALKQLCKNSHRIMIFLEAMDEASYFKYETKLQRDCSMEVDVNTLLSSIIGNAVLPGAKVIITSRPNYNIPSAMCPRTAELYGFPQESIKKYIHKFCGEDTAVEKFITGYLQNNVNIATLCYLPVQANFVCACLANMYSSTHSEDKPSVNTMSQLYVFAVINLAKNLHPSLKDVKEQVDAKKIFAKVGNSFKKHADLAKNCTMSKPLRIIIYEDDLDEYHISNTDKHTGFLAESTTRDLIPCGLKRPCWTYQHLTIQELFAAVGLLRGPPEDLLKLIDDETSVSQHEVLITFITGLLCDPHIAYFVRCLEPAKDQLEPRTFIEKLAGWKNHSLDIHLFKQLCDGLEQNRSIQELNLSNNRGLLKTVEAAEVLGRALTAMTHLRELALDSCGLSRQTLTVILTGLTRGPGGHQLEVLRNIIYFVVWNYNRGLLKTVEAGRELGDTLGTMTRLRRLLLERCDLTDQSLTALLTGLTRHGGQRLEYLSCGFNPLTDASRDTFRRLLTRCPELRIKLYFCQLSDECGRQLREEFGVRRFHWRLY
ncbi:hypothetical protein LSAT2_021718 [Lamellibrachia satsuma]|nr:hypothetical protein LSAT2_021718 [Lamellibrachia satsuma]